MKKSNFSAYENYILLCDKTEGFRMGYHNFLNFKSVLPFINAIANKSDDSLVYEGDIYKKKISSEEARTILENIYSYNCNYRKFRIAANQIGVPI